MKGRICHSCKASWVEIEYPIDEDCPGCSNKVNSLDPIFIVTNYSAKSKIITVDKIYKEEKDEETTT